MATDLLLHGVRLPGAHGHGTVDVAVHDGRVVAVAPHLDLDGLGTDRPNADAERVDGEGRWVLPGLWDHHVHAAQWAASRTRLDVGSAGSPREAADLVRRALLQPTFRGPVLVGQGMRWLAWAQEPDIALLDAAAPDVAVVLQGVDLHTAWANSTALRRVGLAPRPDGLLREAECFHAVSVLADAPPDQQDAAVADAMRAAAGRGVVGIHDFEFGDPVLDWRRRAGAGPLDVRVVANVYPQDLDEAVARAWPTGAQVPDTDGQVRVGHLKVFVDGALNSRSALCHDPYPSTDDHGVLEHTVDELVEVVGRGAAAGLHPAIHAIGDRAVAVACDVLDAVGCPGRVEHAQLVAAADLDRLAAPGRVVGVQPAHLLDDRDMAERLWAGRTDRAFPLASLLAAGARLELGSDAPVSPLDPWRGIAAAVTRTGDDRDPWHPEQAISAADAVRASCGGRLQVQPGDQADLVVVEADPTRCATGLLATMPVWGTWVAGRRTHGG